jgi:hypothetical protein
MQQLEGFGYLAGDNVILKGCEEVGGVVAAGIVFINGEVLPFEGGPVAANVIVAQTDTTKEFEGGTFRPYYLDRKAVFGSGAGQVAWADFKRNNHNNGVLSRLDKVEKMLKPLMGYTADVGGVPTTVYGSWLFWGRPAAEIPAGWEAVPDADWKGRVPVVLDDTDPDFNTVGAVFGEKKHTLTAQELPDFTIQIPGQSGGDNSDHSNTTRLATGDKAVGDIGFNVNVPANYSTGKALGTYGLGHNVVQPSKVVMFIRFIG